jgi:hypothetical protein
LLTNSFEKHSVSKTLGCAGTIGFHRDSAKLLCGTAKDKSQSLPAMEGLSLFE